MVVRRRQLALGTVAALVVLIGPAPADVASLFDHPPPRCLQSRGCGHTHTWWDRPVLVARAAELPANPHLTHATPAARR